MKTCATCKWWGSIEKSWSPRLEYPDRFNSSKICGKIGMDSMDANVAGALYGEMESSLETLGQFGCVAHEMDEIETRE